MTISNVSDTFDAVLADTRNLAADQGKGANARANWLLRVVRGAAKGALDTVTKDKDGRDHAHMLYEAYVTSCGKKNVHNQKTVIAKASNLRKAIEQGARGDIDAVELMNSASTIYDALSKDENIKLKPAFEAFNQVIRNQEKSATELTRDEIKDAMLKEEAEVDVTTHLRAALRAVERAYKMDPNARITEALDAVGATLGFYTAQADLAAKQAELARLQAELAELAA